VKSTIAFVLLFFATASFAGSPPQLPQGTKFLIVSTLGDNLTFDYIGTTVFNNDSKLIDVTKWQVNKYVESNIYDILKAEGYYVPVLSNEPDAAKVVGKVSITPFVHTINFEGGSEGLVKLASGASADYLLIVAPEAFGGYGIYERSTLGLHSARVYVYLIIYMIDGHTGDVLAAMYSREEFTQRPPNLWADKDQLPLNDENMVATQTELFPLLNDAIKDALNHLKLTNKAQQ
jgi:hypothetical protein